MKKALDRSDSTESEGERKAKEVKLEMTNHGDEQRKDEESLKGPSSLEEKSAESSPDPTPPQDRSPHNLALDFSLRNFPCTGVGFPSGFLPTVSEDGPKFPPFAFPGFRFIPSSTCNLTYRASLLQDPVPHSPPPSLQTRASTLSSTASFTNSPGVPKTDFTTISINTPLPVVAKIDSQFDTNSTKDQSLAGNGPQGSATSPGLACVVCGDTSSGKHYGILSCNGCSGFFKRSVRRKLIYRCQAGTGSCIVDKTHRNQCQACRLKKCIQMGMNKDGMRSNTVVRLYTGMYFTSNRNKHYKRESSAVFPKSFMKPVRRSSRPERETAQEYGYSEAGSPGGDACGASHEGGPNRSWRIQGKNRFLPTESSFASLSPPPSLNFGSLAAAAALTQRFLATSGGVHHHLSPPSGYQSPLPSQFSATQPPTTTQALLGPSAANGDGGILFEGTFSSNPHETAARLLVMSVKWAKNLPSFASLPFRDQSAISRSDELNDQSVQRSCHLSPVCHFETRTRVVILLEDSWSELFLLCVLQWSLPYEKCPLFAEPGSPPEQNGRGNATDERETTNKKKSMKEASDLRSLMELFNRFRKLSVDPAEFACLKAIVIFRAEASGLKDPLLVQNLQDQAQLMLCQHCQLQYSHFPPRFGRLLLSLQLLRLVPSDRIESLFFTSTLGSTPVEKLLNDLYKN
ncbi:unnamed protein product [Cyprideis torosa]|uniref:Uncharacterized protein n=1 Tax=Cyprideis torosa TaxID=163714 RepID=A0A7R8ZJF3_9CRUS|nr:unnamed protein product [Cyprideis torosa]CAG0888497.1 unnamed protein product [Cyprideis torosa]